MMYQNLLKKLRLHISYLKGESEHDVDDLHTGIREVLDHIYSIGYNDGLNGYTLYTETEEEVEEYESEEEEL